jgi:hypothetical protein
VPVGITRPARFAEYQFHCERYQLYWDRASPIAAA